MKQMATVIKFQPVVHPEPRRVKPVKRPKGKRGWIEVSLQDALSISLRYGFRVVAWGKW